MKYLTNKQQNRMQYDGFDYCQKRVQLADASLECSCHNIQSMATRIYISICFININVTYIWKMGMFLEANLFNTLCCYISISYQ